MRNPTQERGGDQSPTYPAGFAFLAMVLGCDPSGQRYSFYSVSPAPSQLRPDVFTIDEDPMKYILEGQAIVGAAREANGGRGVPSFSVVRMHFTGYDPNGNPTFVFFSPLAERIWQIPPHDHRDNYNGGFAFSMYHPGTALPQMPFAI